MTGPEKCELDPSSLSIVEFAEKILNIKLKDYQKKLLEEFEEYEKRKEKNE